MTEAAFTAGAGDLLAGRYRLERMVGSGGQGRVFAGVDEALGRRVAVKVLQPPRAVPGGPADEAVARFDREVRALAALDHDHIVKIFDLGVHRGARFSVMEFLDGPSLAQELREHGPLPLTRAVDIAARAADALAAAHALGIWHRDVKPANIQLTGRGRPKLCDFGLVSVLTPNAPALTRRGASPGCTPGFASPEQARGAELTGPTDVFSLGVTLYALLAGGSPFAAADPAAALHKVLHEQAPPLTTYRPDAPPDLTALISSMLHPTPATRPSAAGTAIRLRTALDRLNAASGRHAIYTPTQRPTPPTPGTAGQHAMATPGLTPATTDPPAGARDLAAEREEVTGATPAPIDPTAEQEPATAATPADTDPTAERDVATGTAPPHPTAERDPAAQTPPHPADPIAQRERMTGATPANADPTPGRDPATETPPPHTDPAARREALTGAAPGPRDRACASRTGVHTPGPAEATDEQLWQTLEDAERHLDAGRFRAADVAFGRLSQRLYAEARHGHPAMVAAQLGRVRALDGLGRRGDAEARLARLRGQAVRNLPAGHPLRLAVEGLRLSG
ncbi:hypothetical protein GCM10022403_054660 [Streptomyces coacervatus]|uniref:non-specific serine/threonine protein kinase n=1 Tax=Streptomyces coacervatus TaxID=647381 RepID=A0ABP7IB85_9ACTN|nr:protein kinase [Streptomyces coacervatus]MDF2269169.1 protein kinase [Streptomyces coacervatus]